jgi:hypothetical protein
VVCFSPSLAVFGVLLVVVSSLPRGGPPPPPDRRDYDRALRRIVGVAARRGFPQGRSLTAARQALDARIAELGGER